MQVLLSCVGTRDPYWKEVMDKDGKRHRIMFSELTGDESETQQGPVLSLISAMKSPPDKVYLFSTAEGKDVRTPTQPGGEKTAELLERQNIHVIHWPLNGVNPILFESLVPEFTSVLRKVLNENIDATYSVSVASGTPQMQAVWYVLVNAGLLKARLLRTVDDEIDEVDIDPLFEGEIKNIACSALESFSFSVAADLLSGTEGLALRTRFAERRQRAKLFGELCKVYAAWTIFDYKQANERLDRTSEEYKSYLRSQGLSDIANQIKTQQRMLTELAKSTIPYKLKAVDIFHNTWLHYEMRHYADAVWRASTACELVTVSSVIRSLQQLSGFSFKPNTFRSSVLAAARRSRPESDLSLVCKMIKSIYYPREVPPFLAGASAMNLLSQLASQAAKPSDKSTPPFDKLSRILFEEGVEEQIRSLFDLRNGLVHELHCIKQENAKKAVNIAQSVIEAEFGKEVNAHLRQHPFSVEVFRTFANDVRRLL